MDIRLHYKEKGAGTPLILLHGNSEDHSYFNQQIAYFSERYCVIAIDTRGHGATPRGTAPFTIVQFAQDLYAFMEEKGIQKAHLLGFSDGGNIALTFALQHPERVDKLILNGANLFPKGMKNKVYVWVWRHYWKARWQKDITQQEMMLLMLKQPNISTESLKAIKTPTLVIVGDKDMIKKRHSMLIHKHIKDSQLNIIHGTHFCAQEQPEAFNSVVNRFLEK